MKNNSFSTIIIFILFTLVGMAMIHLLNFQLNPSRSLPSISVNYNWQGNEAKVLEQEVTSKFEAAFAQIGGIKDIHSRSDNGGGQIRLSLDKGVNTDAVRFEISMLIRQIWQSLPQGVSYPTIQADRPDDARERSMLNYTITAPVSPQKIMQYAEDEIKLKLSAIPGIAKVEVSGAEPYEWLVEYHENTLKNAGLTEKDIQNAILLYSGKEGLGLGLIGEPGKDDIKKLLLPVLLGTNQSKYENILKLPVKNSKGRLVFLSDIATVSHIESKAWNYYRVNGLNTININIYGLPGQNQLAVGNQIKQKIKEMEQAFPKGFRIEMGYDANEYVELELKNISLRFIIALGLLLAFVFIIYRQPKYLLLIATTFVVNLSIAAIFYYLFKIEIHLYSLAGITVSLGLMTDNIIIMGDHLRNRGNLSVWLAILAGTMAMASTLIIIFFLDDKIKANLTDFALIVIVNQTVSLFTALFYVPSMMKILQINKNERNERNERNEITGNIKVGNLKRRSKKKNRIKVILVRFQRGLYRIMLKRRWIAYMLLILGFGLPIFMLPAKWEGEKWYHHWYNNTLGSEWYTSNMKPIADKALGGTLRLFVNNVFEGSYFRNNEETSLYIAASLPHGSTIEQANNLSLQMENWLKQYKEIKNFEANVSARQISISLYFKKEYQFSSFPYQLKGMAISKAIELGGAYWGVYGFGDGFSNEVRENVGNYSVKMLGYNYESLLQLAEHLKINLMKNERVKEIYILPEMSWFKPDNTEFIVKLDYEKAALSGISPQSVFSDLKEQTINSQAIASIYYKGKFENVRLQDSKANKMDIWNLNRTPLGNDTAIYRFNKYCSIAKELTAQSVCKENQQYIIYLQFDYIGSDKFARKYIKRTVNEFQVFLPLGYTANDENDRMFWFANMDKNQYWLLGLIVLMIFFICAVLFESLIYPLAVILTIPVSFIGVFLTFYLFDLNFDQGGFASFILLCGITVSAAIYIINDYSVLRRKNKEKKISKMRLYLKAFQYKIIPILLTISASMLGFVPFLIGEKQAFWFSMAAGVCGGLVFSLLGIVFYLPVFLGITEKIGHE